MALGQGGGEAEADEIRQLLGILDFRVTGGPHVGKALTGPVIALENEGGPFGDGQAGVERLETVVRVDDDRRGARASRHRIDQRRLRTLVEADEQPVLRYGM